MENHRESQAGAWRPLLQPIAVENSLGFLPAPHRQVDQKWREGVGEEGRNEDGPSFSPGYGHTTWITLGQQITPRNRTKKCLSANTKNMESQTQHTCCASLGQNFREHPHQRA